MTLSIIDRAASYAHKNPSEAQKESGNYRKGHINFQGLNIAIENARGSMRCGVGSDGRPWQTKMPHHYGYIKGTRGADKDHVDVYIGPAHKSPHVFVIDQKDARTGKFDEHKTMLGFGNKAHALNAYRAGFSDGKGAERIGHVAEMAVPDFKAWLRSEDTTKPIKGRYAAGGAVQGFAGGDSPDDLPDAPWATTAGLPDAPWAATTKPKTNAFEAGLKGAESGASAGFYDEMRGLQAASGLPGAGVTALGLPVGAARLAYEKVAPLFGAAPSGDAGRAYDEAVKDERQQGKTAQAEHPYAYGAGDVAGAMALPAGAATRGATLGARAISGARTGALYGGLYGLGEGENTADRLTRGAVGSVAGGALGAVASPLVEGLVQGGKHLASPIVNAVSGAINPETEAARRVATTLQRDALADPSAASRLTPNEFAASVQNHGPATIMDIGGDLTRRLADSAAITSPEGGTLLNRAINDRYEGQTGRITDWMRQTFNYPDARAQQKAIDEQAKLVNNPAYIRAFNDHDGPLWDEPLAGLAQDPVVQSAIRRASVSVRTDRTLAGYRPMNNPFTFEPSTGRLTLRRDTNGNPMYPDLRFWDQVKRELDKQATPEARSFAYTLRNHLDDLTQDPATGESSYQAARQGAAHFFGAENALDAGQNFVSSKLDNGAARDALQKMTPNQRKLFQDGFVSRFVDQLNEVGDRRSALNSIAQSPAARERLNIALGPQKSQELEAGLRVEHVMDLARSAVQGNSWTARRLYDLGLAGGSGLGAIGAYNTDPKEAALGAVMAAVASGGKHIDQRVARNVAQLLVSQDARKLLQGIRLVARNKNIMDNMRAYDRKVAAVGGSQVPRIAASPLRAITGAVPSRAQDQQQQ